MEEDDGMILTDAINKFTIRFYEEISTMKTGENLIMSPFSAHMVLALLSLGARGKTSDELNASLHLQNSDFTKTTYKNTISELDSINYATLSIANKIFVKDEEAYTVGDEFNTLAANVFSAEIQNVDFSNSIQAVSTINDWVETKTNNKIKNLITEDSLDQDTIMILVNAVYFKGNWKKQFKKELTSKKQFHLNSNENVEIDMMYQSNKFSCAYLDEWDAQAIEMPFGRRNVSMIIILPNQIEGLKDLENNISKADLRKDIFLKFVTSDADVTIPKFKIETTIDLKDILIKLGMNLIFDGNNCDLSGLLQNNGQLCVSKVIQKTFIDINEEGAEAAVVTAVKMPRYSSWTERSKMIFCADHPFYYALVVDYKPLFVGKFIKP